jgi:hypothetical protein
MSNQEELLIENGNNAETLLTSEPFNKSINSIVEATFQAFVNSKPEESENREKTYHHYRAAVDIVNTLKQQVSVRDEILGKNKTDNQEEKE